LLIPRWKKGVISLKRKSSSLIIAIMLLLAFNAFALKGSESKSSSTDAVLFISPSVIADPTITPPAIVAVNVSISNVTNMAYCKFNLSYTPTIFYVVELAKQQVQGQTPSLYYEIEDYLGYIYAQLTYSTPVSVSGEATLLILNFAVVDYGITPLHFHDVAIKDGNSDPIPFETQDGYLAIMKNDIAITDVTISTGETYVGNNLAIAVTLQNYGNVLENFMTTIYANANNISTLQVLNLLPSETRIMTYDWNTTGFPASNTPYIIKAEADILPYETNTTNNVYVDGSVKLKLIGDVNGDGKVDINDLMAWDAAYGSKLGDPNWNIQADINGDEIVDNQDGQLIVQNYRNSL
jgi:hypothetical protein